MSFLEPTKENVITAIQTIMPYTYSQEYMESIDFDRDQAENPLMYDVTLAVLLLGGVLYTKNDVNIQ